MTPALAAQQWYPFVTQPVTAEEQHLLSGGSLPGWCPVCGQSTRFDRASSNLRESIFCGVCHATNRQRQISHALLSVLSAAHHLSLAKLDDLAQLPQGFRVHNTESSGAVHSKLSALPGYTCSEYFGPSFESGQQVGSVIHQDLMHCSLDDESLDLVLSSDVFEHIPEPYVAHHEIFRILKPHGRHIFTVPFYSDRVLDVRRARMEEDGSITHLLEPEYHGDPVRPAEGALVFVVPSLQMLVKLEEIGFTTRVYRPCVPLLGIVGPGAIVFEAAKPPTAA